MRQRKFVEQEEIQREAMIPAKEAKLFTYKLLDENYLQTKPIRKPGGGGTGMAKSFYLFYVNQQQVWVYLCTHTFKTFLSYSIFNFADCINAIGNMLQIFV